MSAALERRLGSPSLGQRWQCLAVDVDELAPRPPRETWLGVSAIDGDLAALAWAASLPSIGRMLVRTHVIARDRSLRRAHDYVDAGEDWATILARSVMTIGRSAIIRGLVGTPDLAPLLAKATALETELADEQSISYFDSRGIDAGFLAHDGDEVVAEYVAGVQLVSFPPFPSAIAKLRPESAIGPTVATALAFWAAR